jgi:multidrug resistance efflux pump
VDLLSVLAGGYYLHKRRILQQEHAQLIRMGNNLLEQVAVAERDLELARQEFLVQQTLADQGVIPSLEYKREESKFLAKQMHLKRVESALLENQTGQSAKLKETLELENLISRQQHTFRQSLNTLRSETESWKQKYLLRAPFDGQVYFPARVEKNQHVGAGAEVFYVSPVDPRLLGELHVRQYNLGKVKTGQRVLIKFESYPFEEFGLVEGSVTSISEIPSREGTFLATVHLPNGLTTTTGKQIIYRTGMVATGEIVTEDTNLIERLFYQLRKAVR